MKPKSVCFAVTLAMLHPLAVRAGTVSFWPETTDIVIGVDDPIVNIHVLLTSLDMLSGLEGFLIVIGSHDGVEMINFSPMHYFAGSFPAGIYPSDIETGYVFWAPYDIPFFIGTLTVDTSGLLPGTYELLVDADFDERSFALLSPDLEPLYGLATIQIVPDPATISLLAAGMALTMLRRDRTRRKACGTEIEKP